MADPKSANGGEKQTIVEEGTELKGSLSSSCPVLVRGRVDGDVATPALTVSPTGSVSGHVKVGALASQGEIAGEFDADTVQLSGRVRDNTIIRAKSLEVKLTPEKGRMQVVFGECSLDVGDTPVRTETIDRTSIRPEKGGGPARGASSKANGGSIPPPPPED